MVKRKNAPVPVYLMERNKKKRARRNYISRMKGPIGRSQVCKLKYAAAITINPTTGGITDAHVFSANGMYDPDISGVGHQPRGFDQLMALYDHYVVLGSKIKCWFTQTGATPTTREPLRVGINLNDDNSEEKTASSDYLESYYSNTALLGPTNEADTVYVEMAVNPNKFLGVKSPQGEDSVKGSASANPVEQCYFHVFAVPMTSADPDAIYVAVELEYTAVLIEPTLVGES